MGTVSTRRRYLETLFYVPVINKKKTSPPYAREAAMTLIENSKYFGAWKAAFDLEMQLRYKDIKNDDETNKGEKSGNIEIKVSEESVVVHKKEEIKQPKDDIIDADKADEICPLNDDEGVKTENQKMDIGDIIDDDCVINTIGTIFVVHVNTSPDVLLILTQASVLSPAHWGLSQEKHGLPQWDPGG